MTVNNDSACRGDSNDLVIPLILLEDIGLPTLGKSKSCSQFSGMATSGLSQTMPAGHGRFHPAPGRVVKASHDERNSKSCMSVELIHATLDVTDCNSLHLATAIRLFLVVIIQHRYLYILQISGGRH